MKIHVAALAVLVAGSLWVAARGQDKPAAPAPAIAVVDLRACFDMATVARVREIDQELRAFTEQSARRLQTNPEDREKLKAQYLELYDRRKAEHYELVDKIVGEIGRERGYALILKKNAVPKADPKAPEAQGESLTARLERRGVLYHDPGIDITAEVLKRLNALPPDGKKKDF